jgi:predicted GNAT family acetyltransferase
MLDDQTHRQLAQVDHRDHEALTAVTADGAVAGIARYIRLGQSSTAEVAVAVADRWRGRGIATLLLQQIAARARAADIDCLTALCLASNTAVLGLLSRLGPMTTTPPDAEVIEVRIDLGRASAAARQSGQRCPTSAAGASGPGATRQRTAGGRQGPGAPRQPSAAGDRRGNP